MGEGAAVVAQLHARPTRALLGGAPVRLIPNGVDPQAFAFDAASRAGLRERIGAATGAPRKDGEVACPTVRPGPIRR